MFIFTKPTIKVNMFNIICTDVISIQMTHNFLQFQYVQIFVLTVDLRITFIT